MGVLNEVLKEYGWEDRITEDNQENLNNISFYYSSSESTSRWYYRKNCKTILI